jgi:hypothetical protein
MDSVVLAVHRKHGHAMPPGLFHHDRPRHHQDLFVGEGDGLAGANRGEDGIEAGSARRRAQHDVGGGMRRHGNEAVPPARRVWGYRSGPTAHRLPNLRERLRARHGDDVGLVPGDLIGKTLDVASRRERDHSKPLRMGVHDGQRALAYRTG